MARGRGGRTHHPGVLQCARGHRLCGLCASSNAFCCRAHAGRQRGSREASHRPEPARCAPHTHPSPAPPQSLYRPFKLNVAAIGNIVAQLHVHVTGRLQVWRGVDGHWQGGRPARWANAGPCRAQLRLGGRACCRPPPLPSPPLLRRSRTRHGQGPATGRLPRCRWRRRSTLWPCCRRPSSRPMCDWLRDSERMCGPGQVAAQHLLGTGSNGHVSCRTPPPHQGRVPRLARRCVVLFAATGRGRRPPQMLQGAAGHARGSMNAPPMPMVGGRADRGAARRRCICPCQRRAANSGIRSTSQPHSSQNARPSR